MRVRVVAALALVLALAFACVSRAAVHDLNLHMDSRDWFLIESFGFASGGQVQINMRNIVIDHESPDRSPVDIVLFVTDSDAGFTNPCATDAASSLAPIPVFNVSCPTTPCPDLSASFTIGSGATPREGLYSIVFRNCNVRRPKPSVTGDLSLSLRNAGGNYLSVGDMPLPYLFFVFMTAHVVLLLLWVAVLCRHRQHARRMHLFMGAVQFVKLMEVTFDALKYYLVMQNGSALGVSVMFYIFSTLKGVMLFALLGVLGSGYMFVRPFLSQNEKRVVLVVLPLQLLANIAKSVMDALLPGQVGWLAWTDIFYLVDIVCSVLVLLPITWSVRRLRQAAESEGRSSRSAMKLAMFQRFYLFLILWLYGTRIVSFLIVAGAPYNVSWLGPAFAETASVVFYVLVGYLFRPVGENPYLRLDVADLDDVESGSTSITMSETDVRAAGTVTRRRGPGDVDGDGGDGDAAQPGDTGSGELRATPSAAAVSDAAATSAPSLLSAPRPAPRVSPVSSAPASAASRTAARGPASKLHTLDSDEESSGDSRTPERRLLPPPAASSGSASSQPSPVSALAATPAAQSGPGAASLGLLAQRGLTAGGVGASEARGAKGPRKDD